MLLITFHGGSSPGINNVYCYDTLTGKHLTHHALRKIGSEKLSELRGMVYANGYLYVANGAKGLSNVLTFQHESQEKAYHFAYVADFIDSKTTGGGFMTAIAHPFSVAMDHVGNAYVSNQDTNVVARLTVAANFQTGTLPTGCQSTFLTGKLCPGGNCTFLDGTFVGSQVGTLSGVGVEATPVPDSLGGLAVSPTTGKIQHSVRDLALAGGVLFVCDEPAELIRLYRLTDGAYLGTSPGLKCKPTHLSVQHGGLLVSAGSQLLWSPLPVSSTRPVLAFQTLLTAPGSTTFGGITFDQPGGSATLYVCVQEGTGSAGGGSIAKYAFSQSNPAQAPVLSDGATFQSGFPDTPEFVLYLPNNLNHSRSG